MDPTRRKRLLVCCAVVVVAAFLTWGRLPLGEPFGAELAAAPLTGWSSHLTLGKLEIPSGLVPAAAIALAVLVELRARGSRVARDGRLLALAAYPVAHCAVLLALLAGTESARIGIGLLAALAASAVALVTVFRTVRPAADAPTPGPDSGPDLRSDRLPEP